MEERAGLKIRLFGDSTLRRKARPVRQITSLQRDTLSKMAQLMYEAKGIGLAGPQVGIDQALMVVDIGKGLYKLINPKLTKRKGIQMMEEGCLSVPGVCLKIKRAKKVLVEAQDESDNPVRIEAEDLLACVLQHEIDHLKGRLIIDYASFFEKLKLRRKLEELRKKSEYESLGQSETKSCKLQL